MCIPSEKDPCYICGANLPIYDCFSGMPIYHRSRYHEDICQNCEKVVQIAKEQKEYLKQINEQKKKLNLGNC